MIQRVLAAVSDAAVTVVVGPRRIGVPPDVIVVQEQPPGGGPVAALAAALEAAEWPPTVAMLAGDLPLFTRDALGDLAAALDGHDGAVFIDGDGREQWLCGLWRTASLRRQVAALPETADQPLRATARDRWTWFALAAMPSRRRGSIATPRTTCDEPRSGWAR